MQLQFHFILADFIGCMRTSMLFFRCLFLSSFVFYCAFSTSRKPDSSTTTTSTKWNGIEKKRTKIKRQRKQLKRKSVRLNRSRYFISIQFEEFLVAFGSLCFRSIWKAVFFCSLSSILCRKNDDDDIKNSTTSYARALFCIFCLIR